MCGVLLMLKPIDSTYSKYSYGNASFQKNSMPKCKKVLKNTQEKVSKKWVELKKEYSEVDEDTKDKLYLALFLFGVMVVFVARILHFVMPIVRGVNNWLENIQP